MPTDVELYLFTSQHDHTPWLIEATPGSYGCRLCGAYPVVLSPAPDGAGLSLCPDSGKRTS